MRGIGETRPSQTPSITEPPGFRHLFDTETAIAYMAWFMDESLIGMRALDVVRTVDTALGRTDVDPGGVRANGQGMGALWVLFAAALDQRIQAAVCEAGLGAYRLLAQTDRYLHGSGIFVRDILLELDLPEVAASTAPRRLLLLAPVDAMKRPLKLAAARRLYEFTYSAYEAGGSPEAFRVEGHASVATAASQYLAALA